MAKTEYRVTASHAVDLACGQMVGPGESTSKVDPENDHDKELIEQGLLTAPPKAERGAAPSGDGKDGDK